MHTSESLCTLANDSVSVWKQSQADCSFSMERRGEVQAEGRRFCEEQLELCCDSHSLSLGLLTFPGDQAEMVFATRSLSSLLPVLSLIFLALLSVCLCMWRPEEGVRFPGAGVTGSCELPDLGTGDQT